MREKPLLLTADNLKLTLEGKKTQTRRLLNPQPPCSISQIEGTDRWTYTECEREWKPRYRTGDQCWLKETLVKVEVSTVNIGIEDISEYKAFYERDMKPTGLEWQWKRDKLPARFMPKKVARYWVEIGRVIAPHRIQSISEEDAIKEGCSAYFLLTFGGEVISGPMDPIEYDGYTAIQEFASLWEEIHGHGAWDRNEWVFGYEYKVIEK